MKITSQTNRFEEKIPSKKEIEFWYNNAKKIWEESLKKQGVSLPLLKRNESVYIQSGVALSFLTRKVGAITTKKELDWVVSIFMNIPTHDIQDGRHLSDQKGWNISKEKRGIYICEDINIPYPYFNNHRESGNLTEENWEEIKRKYKYICYTCGTKEGEINSRVGGAIVILQKGHMDYDKPLTYDNTIAQCQYCNQRYKNRVKFDIKGYIKI